MKDISDKTLLSVSNIAKQFVCFVAATCEESAKTTDEYESIKNALCVVLAKELSRHSMEYPYSKRDSEMNKDEAEHRAHQPSPVCTVNGATTENGVNVNKNSTVTIQLAKTRGVRAWSIRCLTTDDFHVAKDILSGLNVDHYKKTATFTSPNVSDGAAMIFESTVNGGVDANGRNDESFTTRFGVYVLTDNGNLRVGAFDETMEGSTTFGWTTKFNAVIRAAMTPDQIEAIVRRTLARELSMGDIEKQ